jgi:muramoyltetrapeptide carboxypeptidase
MKRRNLLKMAAAASLLSLSNLNIKADTQQKSVSIIKPKKISAGSKVGIIAPGTAVTNPDDIAKCIEVMKYFQFDYKIGTSLLNGKGYKTKSVDERIGDLHEMFKDETVSAVFCIRGGYGSGQLLDKIDYELIKSNPKILLGYSDITALHSAIHKMTGLITFHGPVMLSAFNSYTLQNFKNIFFPESNEIILKNPDSLSGLRSAYPIRTIQPGTASGRLVGGNLSIFSSLAGTKYFPDTENNILFLEDVGEVPFRIDRMLNQLRLSGTFDKCKAIIFGKCNDCDAGESQSTWDLSLGEVLDNYFGKLKIPSFYGLMIGHTPEQLTLPIGCEVSINSVDGTIKLLESPFIN